MTNISHARTIPAFRSDVLELLDRLIEVETSYSAIAKGKLALTCNRRVLASLRNAREAVAGIEIVGGES